MQTIKTIGAQFDRARVHAARNCSAHRERLGSWSKCRVDSTRVGCPALFDAAIGDYARTKKLNPEQPGSRFYVTQSTRRQNVEA